MKKNIQKITAITLAVGCITVGGLGAVTYASGNAYENFKSAVVQTGQIENMTTDLSIQLKEDGKEIISGDVVMQMDGENTYSKGAIKVDGKSTELEQSKTGDSLIYRHGENYYSSSEEMEDGQDERRGMKDSPNAEKLVGMVTDILVGDVKNQFVANGDSITVNLSGAQVPELANVAVAAMVEESNLETYSKDQDEEDCFEIDRAFPITKNAAIDHINITGTVKEGVLSNIQMNVAIKGQNEAGKDASMEMNVTGKMSEVGTTKLNQMDTTGKTIVEKEFRERD